MITGKFTTYFFVTQNNVKAQFRNCGLIVYFTKRIIG